MCRRTGTAALKGSAGWVRYVTLVVGRVEVLAIPAGGEPRVHHDSRRARLGREVLGLSGPRHGVLETCEGELPVVRGLGCCAIARIAGEHAESLEVASTMLA